MTIRRKVIPLWPSRCTADDRDKRVASVDVFQFRLVWLAPGFLPQAAIRLTCHDAIGQSR
jgi:hypothetical protein